MVYVIAMMNKSEAKRLEGAGYEVTPACHHNVPMFDDDKPGDWKKRCDKTKSVFIDCSAEDFLATLPPPEHTPGPVQWIWRLVDSERAHGPFATREQAIADAGVTGVIQLSHAQPVRSEAFMPSIEDILERMAEISADTFCCDGQVFECSDNVAAERDLHAWARRHIHAHDVQWYTGDTLEEIDTNDPPSPPNTVSVDKDRLRKMLAHAEAINDKEISAELRAILG